MILEMKSGFHVVSFTYDGDSVGDGFWEFSRLSPKWLEFGRQHLLQYGMTFDTQLDRNLSHVRVKLTSSSGAGIMTIFVAGKVLKSYLLLGGSNDHADAEMAVMFVESLRKSKPVIEAAASQKPFDRVLHTSERPVLVTTIWPSDTPKSDYDLASEIGLYIAAVFFAECSATANN